MAKKRIISEKLGVNLTIKGQEIQSVIWKKPFNQMLFSGKIRVGAAYNTRIEPNLPHLWSAFESMNDEFDWEFETDLDSDVTIAFSG